MSGETSQLVSMSRGAGPIPTGGEDTADGAGADPVAETDQFTLDPAVAPPGILPGQADDQIT